MAAPINTVRSSLSGIGFPAVPEPQDAMILAMVHQLEQSQWWSSEQLLRHQLAQLELLLSHAGHTVPFYRERLGSIEALKGAKRLSMELFRQIPVLTRAQIREAGSALHARNLPPGHGDVLRARTSGSTGAPLTSFATRSSLAINAAFRLRNHLWHERRFDGVFADIRATDGMQAEPDNWVPGYRSGPRHYFDIRHTAAEQLAWLEDIQPTYLLTHPSNLQNLLQHCQREGVTAALPALQLVSTFGEVVLPEVRALCREVWGLEIVDVYSAVETSIIALQAPGHEHYLVQAERVLVEVLGDDGEPVAPGGIGRVVLTPLHNFAMPLIRYAIGDYAEVGEACPTGRGLPVLKRICGRPRNMLTLPSGERMWPVYPDAIADIREVREFRIVQTSPEAIRVELVGDDVDADVVAKVREVVADSLGHPFAITIDRVMGPLRSDRGKHESFVSEV